MIDLDFSVLEQSLFGLLDHVINSGLPTAMIRVCVFKKPTLQLAKSLLLEKNIRYKNT